MADSGFKLPNLVNLFINNKINSMQESGYTLFDSLQGIDIHKTKNFNDIFVFVVEGTCYNEY